MDNTDRGVSKHGIIIFLEANTGSKSEGIFPFLYETAGKYTRIMLKDDNPFENNGLRPWDGQRVELLCEKGRGDILIINSIVEANNKK